MIPTLRLGGLGNSSVAASGGGGGGSTVDVAAANARALLHMNGTNGSTTFTDETGISWSSAAGPTISTAQSVFGGASGNFGGYITGPNDGSLSFGSGDWTFDCRLRPTTTNNFFCFFDTRAGGTGVAIYAGGTGAQAGKLGIYDNAVLLAEAAGLTDAVWQHIRVCRASGTIYAFIDGALVFSVADSRTYAATTTAVIGGNYLGSQQFGGYIDEVLAMDVALSTAAFTPPAFPYALI